MDLLDQLRAIRDAEMPAPTTALPTDLLGAGFEGPNLPSLSVLFSDYVGIISGASDAELASAYLRAVEENERSEVVSLRNEIRRRNLPI